MTLAVNNLFCNCYFIKNYFIKTSKGGFHVDFVNKTQLLSSHLFNKIIESFGIDEIEDILERLENEKKRRQNTTKQSKMKIEFIKKNYVPLYKYIYILDVSYLDEKLIEIAELCRSPSETLKNILSNIERIPGSEDMFKIPIFTTIFCQDLVSEIENFQNSDLPKGKPNSMNSHGVLLEEIGFYERFINPLRELYLNPICNLLYPKILKDGCLDSQKAFVVTYKMDADVDLDIHYDNSEVTCNISISNGFTDGDLYFKEQDDYLPFKHVCGWCVIHPGSKLHGSLPISSGIRHNVIIWMRSSRVRNEFCPMCKEKPQLVEIEGSGDGFTR